MPQDSRWFRGRSSESSSGQFVVVDLLPPGVPSFPEAAGRKLRRSASRAAALGAAGVLAVCPYYNRPSQAGIEAHMRAMAGATTLPVVVYDIPVRTGRKISTQVLLRLAREVSNVVAVKTKPEYLTNRNLVSM